MSVLTFRSVTKTYPGTPRPALDRVDVHIAPGEFVFLVGASGSGKSTVLRLLLRETRADSGRVLVEGRDVARLPGWRVPRLRRAIGTVFQDFQLLPDRTVAGNVAFALQVLGRSRAEVRAAVAPVLELVGLTGREHRLPDQLSAGEQQRVAIARAFVNRPRVLLADEPTGNLDPGTTVLMATHDVGVVDQLRKRVVELHAGRVVRDQARGVYGAA